MPTANRRRILPLALQSFLSQDWQEKELIVVDDGNPGVADLVAGLESVTYIEQKGTIGGKLNLACEAAKGDILIRWDDDDWSSADRMSDQVNRLLEANAEISGYHSIMFWDHARGEASKYCGARDYAVGTSICFTRSYWNKQHFLDSSKDEDNQFIRLAQRYRSIVSVDAGERMVASVSPRRTHPLPWGRVPDTQVPQAFFEATRCALAA